jgi:hypothetical protein
VIGITTAGYSEPWLLWIVVAKGWHQGIEFAERIDHVATLEGHHQGSLVFIDPAHHPKIAVGCGAVRSWNG